MKPADVTELKPCPFCGGEAATRDWHYRGTGSSGMETPEPYVICTKCRTEQPRISCDDTPYGKRTKCMSYAQAKVEAITAWNTRTPDAFEAGRVAGLEEAAKVAEEQSDYITVTPFVHRDRVVTAIRALKEKK